MTFPTLTPDVLAAIIIALALLIVSFTYSVLQRVHLVESEGIGAYGLVWQLDKKLISRRVGCLIAVALVVIIISQVKPLLGTDLRDGTQHISAYVCGMTIAFGGLRDITLVFALPTSALKAYGYIVFSDFIVCSAALCSLMFFFWGAPVLREGVVLIVLLAVFACVLALLLVVCHSGIGRNTERSLATYQAASAGTQHLWLDFVQPAVTAFASIVVLYGINWLGNNRDSVLNVAESLVTVITTVCWAGILVALAGALLSLKTYDTSMVTTGTSSSSAGSAAPWSVVPSANTAWLSRGIGTSFARAPRRSLFNDAWSKCVLGVALSAAPYFISLGDGVLTQAVIVISTLTSVLLFK